MGNMLAIEYMYNISNICTAVYFDRERNNKKINQKNNDISRSVPMSI